MKEAADLTPDRVRALPLPTLKALAVYLDNAREGVMEELAARERVAQRQGGSIMGRRVAVRRTGASER